MKSLFLLTALLGAGAFALNEDVGPLLYEFSSTQVSGGFEGNDNAWVEVAPGSEVRCSLKIKKIAEHYAGKALTGWYFDFDFKHPKYKLGYEPEGMSLFWNHETFSSPFSAGFKMERTHLEPFSDPPTRMDSDFDHKTRVLLVHQGGLIGRGDTLQITLSPDGKRITRLEMLKNSLGADRFKIVCEAGA